MSDDKKVAWNISQGLIIEISNRRSYANTYFVNGDIRKAFNNLIAIKQSVIQSLSKEERDKLKNIENKFNKVSSYLYSSSANSFNNNLRNAYLTSKSFATKLYFEYNDVLMDLLQKYDYLIGEKSDASKMRF